ncbi:MurR/RpiR family transcriptional regulator [Pseudidiomarina terrestris]|uniref:MurR/RpiR family transcriptional regulator n=1 Tax=Pseudidiomarina terrestris TaxID=2820060 RepID=A0AAW7R1J2_9GAMM|nr:MULTISPECIES: MurR/RpiR family transcriptional regulator [unclassified Pseudidiomarina]MDN7125622.1 MurR/RpiR family transcriptional regulator [Pseudidiomarina sp. 1APP75-32.1]MDN7126128.1 MurR/RpiR family transcriptional regulator [Pseudidiomarina sp. 1APR75-33.1]MDN7130514.1 MurR/RpiR family transcriptional regulator [Pseudidiomarina sp. 1APR75-15]MDN7134156.1 MurR/RpiR family transcriptional regulator [Pseudidiomarina sp. 1ASP75-5]MDN7137157.1 MurR/RpiR family transcriptional regulator [
MSCLLKIRAMREDMSLIERKLADFILENTHLLRDYSSQQLADAIGVSQSSVVKFSQKLGYRGYPDLKFAVNEAVVSATSQSRTQASHPSQERSIAATFAELRDANYAVMQGVADINEVEKLQQALRVLTAAETIQVMGFGKSAIVAKDFVLRLMQMGKVTLSSTDPALQVQMATTLSEGSVLFAISDGGQNSDVLKIVRQAKSKGAKVISLTRYGNNPTSVLADISLFALGGDTHMRMDSVLMQLGMQHLCHMLYVQLCQTLKVDSLIEESMNSHNLLDTK